MTISKKKATTGRTTGRAKAMHGKLVVTKRGSKVQFFPASSPSPKKPQTRLTPKRHGRKDQSEDHISVVYEFDEADLSTPKAKHTSKTPKDYMAEWLPKQARYLDEILRRESPETPSRCSHCLTTDAEEWWRCKECCGTPVYCEGCCRLAHMINPLHRVERYARGYFSPSWLWICGVSVNLCPTQSCEPIPVGEDQPSDEEPDHPDDVDPTQWTAEEDLTFGAKPSSRTYKGMRVLVVVHSNGIHHLPFHFCGCVGAAEDEYQLLRLGFYPSTPKKTRTVFTFALLDEYLLETLETFASTHHIFSKLRRLTNEPFPHVVPNRVRELRRVGRQWRKLKDLKRYGFGHTKRVPHEGNLALFCPACPQPGINLPENWMEDPEEWKFTRSFVADGNFTCVHRKGRHEEDDPEVYLKNGEGYMTERATYTEHLESSTEFKEIPTCHEHRAVSEKSKVHKGCDVTGIGAIACMRHGAFVPGSVVDFQKGERQVNMDWALSQALKLGHLEDISRVILAYDINCQYSKRFYERFDKSGKLQLPDGIELLFAIGLFHVHGHLDACNARYSLTYMQGAGMASGEILESLWAVVNEVARATSTMTLAHRLEVLDAIFGDINWKKLVNLVPSICKNWANSRIQLLRAQEDFDLLDETASAAQRKQWESQLTEANEKRTSDVKSMDVLNAQISKPPTLARTRTKLMEREQELNKGIGITSWLAWGIRIQESQIELKAHIRGLPKTKTDLQTLEVARKREQLQSQVNELYDTAASLFPDADFSSLKYNSPPRDPVAIEGADNEDDDEENPFSLTQNEVEDVSIPLPSSFDDGTDLPSSIQKARRKELELRIAQAEDTLEGIRTHIGHKSYLYRSNIRLAEGKKQKTRGYAAVNAVDKELRNLLKVYNHARWAMARLGADDNTRLRYRPIRREDTRAVTVIYKPNARGERNKPLPWIWNMNVEEDSSNSAYLEEIYRVNWLRAKSRLERWREEHILLTSEMEWVINFFSFKQDECKVWAMLSKGAPGHVAYARKQADMWRLMAANAQQRFEKTRRAAGSDNDCM